MITEIKRWLLRHLICDSFGHWWYEEFDIHLYGVEWCRWCQARRGELKLKEWNLVGADEEEGLHY